MSKTTVNSYLRKLSESVILRNEKFAKINIDRSISSLKTKLKLKYKSELENQFIFGSYKRKTNLPRFIDKNTDVDYMVIFSDSTFQPQTYLDRLKRFVDKSYPNTRVKQDHPAIRLDLNHIRFELVPAINKHGTLYIPAKTASYGEWIKTNPHEFIKSLAKKNQAHQNFIKPLIRVMKYWNASNGYPFESFQLEKEVVECSYSVWFFSTPNNLKGYFYKIVEHLFNNWDCSMVHKTHAIVEDVKELEEEGRVQAALLELQKILPVVNLEKA